MIEARFDTTVDQVENTIKPYKFDVECSEIEWKAGILSAGVALEEKIKANNEVIRDIRKEVGRRRMRQALAWIEKNGTGDAPFADGILDQAREVKTLTTLTTLLASRLSTVKSRACRSDKSRVTCPEIYLHMLSDKLAYTSAMFVDVEMLREVYFDMPRELEQVLYYGVRGDEVGVFARENAEVGEHLGWLRRSEVLKEVEIKLRELKDERRK
jgi:hypothetical protein